MWKTSENVALLEISLDIRNDVSQFTDLTFDGILLFQLKCGSISKLFEIMLSNDY